MQGRELSVGAGSDRRFGGEIFATRLSDPPEAWVEPTALEPTAPPRDAGAVVVRDRRTSSELTRAPVDPLPSDISLRADGTLAFATAARPYDDHYDARVAVLDPGATTSRILPVRLRSRLNGWIGPDLGVVAADRPDSNSGALQLIDAQGRTTRRIAELGEDPALLNLTDVSGTRAAWVTRGCKSAEIRSMPPWLPEQPRYAATVAGYASQDRPIRSAGVCALASHAPGLMLSALRV